MEGVLVAIRILTEHIGMSTDARRRIAVAIGDAPAIEEPIVPVDPRDAELAELRRQLAEKNRPAFSEEPITVRKVKVKGLGRPVTERSRKNRDGTVTVEREA